MPSKSILSTGILWLLACLTCVGLTRGQVVAESSGPTVSGTRGPAVPSHAVGPALGTSLSAIGYDVPEYADGGETTLSAAYGDSLAFSLYLRVDGVAEIESKEVRLVWGGPAVAFRPADLVDAGRLEIGGVYVREVVLPILPVPEKDNPLPFLAPRSYPLELVVVDDRGGEDIRQTLADIHVAPMFSGTDSTFCLTDNADVDPVFRRKAFQRVLFPGRAPVHHPSGNGDSASELTDGIFTGTNSPGWESVSWKGDWGPQAAILEMELDVTRHVSGVVVVCPRPYPNYRADRLTIELLGREDANVASAHTVYPLESGGFLVFVAELGRAPAFSLRLMLHQDSGATDIVLSEVYVFGR